jgi:hypothetical protein
MRNVPCYQIIRVKNSTIGNLYQELKEINNKLNPHVIDLTSLELVEQKKILNKIYDHLKLKINDFFFPYPIYFLTEVRDSDINPKNIFQVQSELPKFYFRKERRTTRIHANISRLNGSAEKNLDLYERNKIENLITSYSIKNKKIHQLSIENSALQLLKKKMEDLS